MKIKFCVYYSSNIISNIFWGKRFGKNWEKGRKNRKRKKKTKKNQPEIPRPPGLRFTNTFQMVLNSSLSWTLIAVQKRAASSNNFCGKKLGKKEKRMKHPKQKKNKKEPTRNSAFHQYDSNGPKLAPLLDLDSSPKKGEAQGVMLNSPLSWTLIAVQTKGKLRELCKTRLERTPKISVFFFF